MTVGVLAKRGLLLGITGGSLYLLAPALAEVFGAFDRLDDFNPLWYLAMVGLQVGSYACMWMVQKIAVRAHHLKPIARANLVLLTTSIGLFGHTHLPMVYAEKDGAIEQIEPGDGG